MNENMSENTRALGFLPPLGWNSWNTFTWDINESLIFEIADCMVKTAIKMPATNILLSMTAGV